MFRLARGLSLSPYTSILCLLGYAVFGPSRILVLGPDSSLGPKLFGFKVSAEGLNVFRRAWWPYQAVLGRVEGLEGYHDARSYPAASRLPGLVIYRFDAPLFFANAKTFRDEVMRIAQADPLPSWILIAAEPITDVDTTASDVLEELDETLNARRISLVFAELKDPVRGKIERYGLTRTIDPDHFFPTVEAAVTAFRAGTGADWTPAVQPEADPTTADPTART
jgi:anti-anti-sigma regulatory factor